MKYVYSSLLIISFLFASCKKGHEMKTDSGFRYLLYTESKGATPKLGDYVTIIMSYQNDNDSIIFDWKTSGAPIRFQLEKIPFKGSFEDGLTYIAENDSATFFVPADSLYKHYYMNSETPQSKTAFLPGTFLKFNIRLLKVQTPAQAEEEMLLKQSLEEKKERVDIFNYISKHQIKVTADSTGYYLVVNEKGNGEVIDSGKVVTIEYEGKFLNDSVFDGTKSGAPYKFIFGAHRVIHGWELAMKNLNAGDKITLLVPSKLAYGEEGIRDPASAKWVIAPNTPLIFDIHILNVEDAPAVSRN